MGQEPALKKGQELSIRTVPFPRDKNYNGDIFGGWVLEQMDLAGSVRARKFVGGAAVPVAINAMTFNRPVSVLDEVSFYTEIEKVGKSSVTVKVEAWALREDLKKYEKVTEGSFVYVSVDKDRKPQPINPKP
ncbi:MAG: acyl-CoA thioesterase [Rhodospirillales bacterium]|nr:acyl-CoA thioesterase [Rhodospirillales bacterium]MCB9995560.1 acyl-CoA thioesterase [Rhodospirillales bacterium]